MWRTLSTVSFGKRGRAGEGYMHGLWNRTLGLNPESATDWMCHLGQVTYFSMTQFPHQ